MTLFQSFLERSNSTFNMSIWYGGKMSNSEYAGTPSLSEQYYQSLTLQKNYTLQPQNEIQSQYYHSQQVSIMVHITYRHGPNRNEEKCVILKESHFYISDERTHDIHYMQHCFKLFYDHVIAMDIPFLSSFDLVRWLC